MQLSCRLEVTRHEGAVDGWEVGTLQCVKAGEVRGMRLSNQEGNTGQEPVRPASWQQQQRHKPHCYFVRMPWALVGATFIGAVPDEKGGG